MIHLLYFITRKPSLGEAEFHRYWRDTHGPIAARIPQLVRYEQSHRIPFAGTNSSYDGAAEAWLENEAALHALRHTSEYVDGALADEPNFIDMNRVEWLVTQDRVILDGPQSPGLTKGIFQLRRKPGLSLADFRRYWVEVHAPIVKRLPGLRRYVQCHTVDAAYDYAEPRWDGIAQLWVDSPDTYQAMLDSPEFQNESWPDGGKFLDLDLAVSFVAQEHQVKWG